MTRIADVVEALTARVEALENKKSWKISYDAIISLMTLQLVTLKLTDVIDWSWIFVLSPLYLPISIAFVLGIFIIATGSTEDAKKGKNK